MEFTEKARIRLEHWVKHDQDHLAEYRAFARELDAAGQAEAARAMTEMADHTQRGLECLRRSLAALVPE